MSITIVSRKTQTIDMATYETVSRKTQTIDMATYETVSRKTQTIDMATYEHSTLNHEIFHLFQHVSFPMLGFVCYTLVCPSIFNKEMYLYTDRTTQTIQRFLSQTLQRFLNAGYITSVTVEKLL